MTSNRDESSVDSETDEESAAATRASRRASARAGAKATTNKIRTIVAQVIWLICVVAALILAIGALCIALKANPHNSLVTWFVTTADKLDLGVFSRQSGVFHWKGHSHAAQTKNALVNWGIAAVVWLVVGKILERIIRPSTPVTTSRR